jgi:hypothetical protein
MELSQVDILWGIFVSLDVVDDKVCEWKFKFKLEDDDCLTRNPDYFIEVKLEPREKVVGFRGRWDAETCFYDRIQLIICGAERDEIFF